MALPTETSLSEYHLFDYMYLHAVCITYVIIERSTGRQ